MEIPRCESCGRIAQYRCAVDGRYICCQCARFAPISKDHLVTPAIGRIETKVVEKMNQDPKERTIFEALEDLTGCPPPEEIDLETEWKPWPGYVYGHEEYRVKTMAVYVDGEHAGYLDFMFTMDPEEEMSIQFWEIAIHPKFQAVGVFSTMIGRLKEIARQNNVRRLYVSHENDNLPAIVAEYSLGARILYVKDLEEDAKKQRFAIPRRNDIIFVHELEE